MILSNYHFDSSMEDGLKRLKMGKGRPDRSLLKQFEGETLNHWIQVVTDKWELNSKYDYLVTGHVSEKEESNNLVYIFVQWISSDMFYFNR